jgi:hypothetical protein
VAALPLPCTGNPVQIGIQGWKQAELHPPTFNSITSRSMHAPYQTQRWAITTFLVILQLPAVIIITHVLAGSLCMKQQVYPGAS